MSIPDPLPIFLIWLFVFLLLVNCKISLYILDTIPSSGVPFAKTFSYSLGVTFLMVSFDAWFLNFDEAQLKLCLITLFVSQALNIVPGIQ